MPEVQVMIGGREFTVACQAGEEPFLQTAAKMLDTEAAVILGQIGRMPPDRMLLMAGLMLADKTAGLEEDLRRAQAELAEARAVIEEFQSMPPPEPERVEVPMIPPSLVESLAELAAQAEAVADEVEARAAG